MTWQWGAALFCSSLLCFGLQLEFRKSRFARMFLSLLGIALAGFGLALVCAALLVR